MTCHEFFSPPPPTQYDRTFSLSGGNWLHIIRSGNVGQLIWQNAGTQPTVKSWETLDVGKWPDELERPSAYGATCVSSVRGHALSMELSITDDGTIRLYNKANADESVNESLISVPIFFFEQ